MSGDAGNDVLVGGADGDTLDGGAGTDTADYSGSGAGVNVTINASGNTGGDAAGDTLAGIENLIGSSNGDTLVGDAGNNVIDGADGADTISGGAGNDTLIGGAGIDTISGGTGNNSISGGTENDVIDGGSGNDTIDGGSGDNSIVAGPATIPAPQLCHWISTGAHLATTPTLPVGATQDTGGINVGMTLTPGQNFSAFTSETGAAIYTAPGETFSTTSAGYLNRSNNGDPTQLDIDFSSVPGSGMADEVTNVQFRISDIDEQTWKDRIIIRAYDADGNLITVTITEGQADIASTSSGTGATITAVEGGGNTDPKPG